MAPGALAFASADLLVAAAIQGGAGLASTYFFRIHHFGDRPYTRAWSGHSEDELAAENPCTNLLGVPGPGAGAAAVRRAANSKDPAGTRSHAGTRHLAVHGNTRLPNARW